MAHTTLHSGVDNHYLNYLFDLHYLFVLNYLSGFSPHFFSFFFSWSEHRFKNVAFFLHNSNNKTK